MMNETDIMMETAQVSDDKRDENALPWMLKSINPFMPGSSLDNCRLINITPLVIEINAKQAVFRSYRHK